MFTHGRTHLFSCHLLINASDISLLMHLSVAVLEIQGLRWLDDGGEGGRGGGRDACFRVLIRRRLLLDVSSYRGYSAIRLALSSLE